MRGSINRRHLQVGSLELGSSGTSHTMHAEDQQTRLENRFRQVPASSKESLWGP